MSTAPGIALPPTVVPAASVVVALVVNVPCTVTSLVKVKASVRSSQSCLILLFDCATTTLLAPGVSLVIEVSIANGADVSPDVVPAAASPADAISTIPFVLPDASGVPAKAVSSTYLMLASSFDPPVKVGAEAYERMFGSVSSPLRILERIKSCGPSVIFTDAPRRCDFLRAATDVLPVSTDTPRVMLVQAVPVQLATTNSSFAVPSSMMKAYVLDARAFPSLSVALVSVIEVAVLEMLEASVVSKRATGVGIVAPRFWSFEDAGKNTPPRNAKILISTATSTAIAAATRSVLFLYFMCILYHL